MNDDELQRLYQEGMRRPEETPAAAPDPALLLRVARGEAPEAERLRVLDAVMQSDALRREYDTFRALALAPQRRGVIWPRLLAAAAVLVVAGGAVLWTRSAARDDTWRGEGGQVSPVSPHPDAAVSPPVTLVWHAVAGAHAYDVELLAEDGHLVARFETPDTMQIVPDSAGLLPGGAYRWAVTARLNDGASARSDLVRFSLRP